MLSCVSGPPFTHQCAPEHMIYYGQSSCESDLDRYLESLKSLWRRRSQSRETPVIINTMGWVKGQLTPLWQQWNFKCANCDPPERVRVSAVRRVWISAAGGHDPLLPGLACRPARSQWHHTVSTSHARVSEDSTGLPDAPTCPDRSGRVHREPNSPQKLHSPHRTVRVSRSGAPRNFVSSKYEMIRLCRH